ncbi:MAG: hypothetical protein JW915_19350 [Chitinispirillaceae bacterium]|nr:hypothetical protein [Chitinispirillaceae bacterium]
MNYQLFSVAVTLIVVLQSHLFGAVIFQDDFSDPVTSYQNWVSLNSDFNKPSFVDGACKVENTNDSFTSYVSTQLALPSTFTYSCTITRTAENDNAGIVFYFNASNTYKIILDARYIFIMEPNIDTALSISCPYLNGTTDKITVSRKDAIYNIFVNDQFITTFSDNNSRSGSIGFVNSPRVTAIYDNVVVTDQFLEGTSKKCYADGFDDASLKLWEIMEKKSTRTIENGKLHISTENNDTAYCFLSTSLKLTNFVVRVEVSHIQGSEQSIYGIRLYDSTYSKTASFVINGERKFGSVLNTGELTMSLNSKILGTATMLNGVLTTFTNTLEIVRQNNSPNYYCVVNNDTLDTLTGIDFNVAHVGFFCQKNLTLDFDNFAAAEGDSAYCPSGIRLKNRSARGVSIRPAATGRTYDILGRSMPAIRLNGRFYQNSHRASGIYLENTSKKGSMEIR